MIIKTIVPKLGDEMYYLGKPVTNGVGERIGSISEVIDDGDHYTLIMDVPCVYSKPDKDEYSTGVTFEEACKNIKNNIEKIGISFDEAVININKLPIDVLKSLSPDDLRKAYGLPNIKHNTQD